jgi:excisionase family DNA binding protein
MLPGTFPISFCCIPPDMLKTQYNLPKAAAKQQLAEADQFSGLGTKDDVAKLCQVSKRTVELWIQERRIPFIRLGHRLLRFDLDAVKAAVRRWSTKEIK